VLIALVVVTVLFSAALLALVRDVALQRRAVARLERRIATLEHDGAATVVIEPGNEVGSPPRPPNALVN
jgi:hypothetical protein